MSKYLRGNEDRKTNLKPIGQESLFAQQALANVGGSCVYIAPKKVKKFIDTDKIE